jgi:hypothetical protein
VCGAVQGGRGGGRLWRGGASRIVSAGGVGRRDGISGRGGQRAVQTTFHCADPRCGTRIPWMAGRGVDGAPSMDGGPPSNWERRSATDGPIALHAAVPKLDYAPRRQSPCSAISLQPRALLVPSTLVLLPSSSSSSLAWAGFVGCEGDTEVDWSREVHRHAGLVDILVVGLSTSGKRGAAKADWSHGGSGTAGDVRDWVQP